MLRELAVQNLALIEDVRVELHPGFCAWTGETGAGKSLLLGALGLLLGERGSAELIRAGADELRVTGRFELTRPEQREAAAEILQSPVEEDDLILTRRLSRAGRSSALVNDVPVAVATLKRIGEMLVDVHGQRESYSLLQPALPARTARRLRQARRPAREVRGRRPTRVRELRRQFKELSDARAEPAARAVARPLRARGPRQREAHSRANSPRSRRSAKRSSTPRASRSSPATVAAGWPTTTARSSRSLGRLLKDAQRWAGLDPKLAGGRASGSKRCGPRSRTSPKPAATSPSAFEADPDRLEEVEQRHRVPQETPGALRQDAGRTDRLPRHARREGGRAPEAGGRPRGHRREHCKSAWAELRKAADVAEQGPREGRQEARGRGPEAPRRPGHAEGQARRGHRSQSPLPDDPMAGDVPASGIDHLELMLTANPGEPARPLRKVASGGELSRTMLALKTVLAAHDPVRTLVVFDEIDANVGGRLGDVLGREARGARRSRTRCSASRTCRRWRATRRTSGRSARPPPASGPRRPSRPWRIATPASRNWH